MSLGPLGHPEVSFFGAGPAQDGPYHIMWATRHFAKRVVETMGHRHVDKWTCAMKFKIHPENPCRDIMIGCEVAAIELGGLPRLLRISRPIPSGCNQEAE